MPKWNNYERAKVQAQEMFARLDTGAIARAHGLKMDEDYLYAEFLNRPCRVHRATGRIENSTDGFCTLQAADFSQSLAMFDHLQRPGPFRPCGSFAQVNSLRGLPRGHAGVPELHHTLAEKLDRNPAAFTAAAQALGGTPWPLADVGFRLQIFPDVPVLLGLYHADEDFPATLITMWDAATLETLLYESIFYAAGCLFQRLAEEFDTFLKNNEK